MTRKPIQDIKIRFMGQQKLSWQGETVTSCTNAPAGPFWLLREPGASMALGTCPGPECFQFTLGRLRTEGGSLIQQIFLSGPGFGVRRYPGPGLRLHMDNRIRVNGSNISFDNEKMWVELALARGNVFEMSTELADISFKVLDTRSDSLRIHLEVRHGSYVVWPKYPNALLYHRLRLHHDARFSLNFITL